MATARPHLYFAYGSNLDRAQMRRRCPGSRFAGVAELPGYVLTFGGHSARWAGAVATVRPRRGESVSGALYALTDADLASLDLWEGCPAVYVRQRLRVLDADGVTVRAIVYVQRAARPRRAAPGPEYFGQIRRAYDRLGFDASALARAAWGVLS